MASQSRTPSRTRESVPRGAVLITGVSTGIGRAIALQLLKDNYLVFGTVRKLADGAYLSKKGGQAVLMDVTNEKSIRLAYQKIQTRLKEIPLVGLVNNAGITVSVPWEHVSLADLRRQLEVNLIGVAAVTKQFLPLLKISKGKIIMISSTAGRTATALIGPYSCSKFALEAMVDSLRQELWRDGVSVTSIQPGPTRTPIWSKTAQWTKKHYDRARKTGSFGRFESVAKTMGETGMDAAKVAQVVADVLCSKRPPLRKIVARNPLLFFLQSLIPARLMDRLVVKTIYGTIEKE